MEVWAWHNQYSGNFESWPTMLKRASEVDGVIVKASLPDAISVYQGKGVPLAIEEYIYPDTRWDQARAMVRIAKEFHPKAIVINAEVEWEPMPPNSMAPICEYIRFNTPEQELWYSVDTRGGRCAKPYQVELMNFSHRCLPMIYPQAYYPNQPPGYVAQAFADALVPIPYAEFQHRGLEIHPTIQLYNNIGADAVAQQVQTAKYFKLPGISVYTIGHATEEEWRALMTNREDEAPPPTDVATQGAVAIVRVVLAKTCLTEESNEIASTLRTQLAWLEAQQPES